jgi:hypothetical protein
VEVDVQEKKIKSIVSGKIRNDVRQTRGPNFFGHSQWHRALDVVDDGKESILTDPHIRPTAAGDEQHLAGTAGDGDCTADDARNRSLFAHW